MGDDAREAGRVLEYGAPERGWGAFWRRVPRLSGSTWGWILLAGVAVGWVVVDHEAWVVERTWPAGTSALRASPDGRRVIVGSERSVSTATGPFQVVDSVSGEAVGRFGERQDYAADATFSPDGNRVVTVGGKIVETVTEDPASGSRTVSTRVTPDRPVVRLWDVGGGKMIAELGELGSVNSSFGNPRQVHWSPDGRRIVTLENERARLWDGVTGKLLGALEGREKADGLAFVGDAAWFSPDGARAVVRMLRGSEPVRVRSTEDGRVVAEHRPAHGTPNGIDGSFSPDGRWFAFADYGWVYAIDAATGSERWPAVKVGGNPNWVGYSADGKGVFVLHDQQAADALTKVEAATGRVLATTRPAGSSVSSRVAWSPDGKVMALFSFGGTVEVFGSSNLQLLHRMVGREAGYSRRFFSGDGRRAAVLAERPRRVEIVETGGWRVTSEIRDRWSGMQGRFTDVAFVGGDGRRVMTATDTGVTRVWRLRRAEGWWGTVMLVQFWVAVGMVGVAVWAVGRDAGRWRRGE